MKIALIGLPQSGKTTLFSLLTGRVLHQARKAGESPEGKAPIRDARVDALARLYQPQRTVYAENHFVLCPDLIRGGPAGDWIEAARRCDLLCPVLREFTSDQVYHPEGALDAARDRATIESELLLADMERIEKRLQRLEKEKRAGGSTEQRLEAETLARCMEHLENGEWLETLPLEPHAREAIKSLDLATFIPRLPVYNVDEEAIEHDHGEGTLSISARIEQEIMEIEDPGERREYLQSLGIHDSGLDRMNAAAYDRLGLMSFYTVGKDEVRAWTIRKGSTAPVAGGKIHSDIERGFIRVEVIKYDDLIAAGSEQAAKAQGKMLLKGADYVIEDGDICHFLFNV